MFTDEDKKFAEIIDQPVDEAPTKRARPKKPPAKSAGIESDHRSEAPKKPAQSKRGHGRPRGAKNKLTIARDEARKVLDQQKLAIKIEVMKEPKDILLESANYFWARAQFLSNHARKLADEDASATAIDAIMEEADRQLNFACNCAEKAAPYFHARVSTAPQEGDAVLSFVARLPSPVEDSEQWARESNPNPAGQKRTQ